MIFKIRIRVKQYASNALSLKGGAIVLMTQNFDPAKSGMDKMQLSEISTAK